MISLDPLSYPQKNTNFELTELEDEIILFSVQHEKAVYFNPTAQLIWHLCDGQQSIAEIIEGLQEQYPDEVNIENQISFAIEKMIEDTIITLSETSST